MSDKNSDKNWPWFQFKPSSFWKNLPFSGFGNNFLKQDIHENLKELMNWVTEYSTEFIFPNIKDKGTELVVTINTPGIPKKNLKIKTDSTSITIIIKKEDQEREIKRKINLPSKIIPNKSYSTYKDGQLKVFLTKDRIDEDISIN